MQAKTKTEPYEFFEPVFEGRCEVPIDTDYNLPDYCADIQRILKCRAIPEISSYIATEDSIICDGICDIRVIYLDGSGEGVKCCDFTKEFSTTIKIDAGDNKPVASVTPSIEHLTCRAMSARRIDLHISICLDVLAVVQKRENITTEIEDQTIEKKTETIKTSQAVNAVCHQFSIEEYIPLKSGKPPIETILRRDTCCHLTQYSASEERLNVEGVADISFLYASFLDGVTCEKMNSSIEFSQSIECAGADEDCICDVKVICGESSIQPKEDSMGEYTGVTVFMKIFVVAFLYKDCEVSIIDDAYSVDMPVELNYTQSNFMQIHDIRNENIRNKCSISVSGEEINKIVDIWNEQTEVSTYFDKGELNYRIKNCICLLYINSQGRTMYTEKPFDSSYSSDMVDEKVRKCDVSFYADIWEYRITDKSSVEVSVETVVKAMLYTRFSIKQLTSAVSDESQEYSKSGSKLLIYYAYKGEKLWDIAKEHKALLTDIRMQNEISNDVIEEEGPIIICNR